ncbi:MAG: double-strand break repair helicase AddA [Roseovarius sp.]
MAHDDATLRQMAAARPSHSTWVSANAGSGKTKVLTDRVARLLLEQVDPQHILCLTYTKAAASEMQNRLFGRLGSWAMLPDDELTRQLVNLGHGSKITDTTLREARRLFARAIETPGGLKIQTIHSFCSALLRRFPLEAGVSPQFTEMEDRAASLLRAEILETLASGPERGKIDALARHYSGETFEKLTETLVKHRTLFADTEGLSRSLALLEITPDATPEEALAIAFDGSEPGFWPELLERLRVPGGATYPAIAARLAQINTTAPTMADLELLFGDFLYQSDGRDRYALFDSKSINFPQSNHTKAVAALEPVLPELHALMDRVAEAKQFLLRLEAARKCAVLHDFAQAFLPAYEKAKQLRGWLDFDDLILRARDLLTVKKVADWVLYKIDGGIDHILVDEAQDTSPVQWQVIESLAREFTSGEGARTDVARTLFVVGDKKQSIYSFQGADPREFDRMRDEFKARLAETQTPLQDLPMEVSFRSSPTILRLVDEVFKEHEWSGFEPDQRHIAFNPNMPGRVDLWPVVEKPETEEETEWYRPVDMKAPNAPSIVLARQVARAIEAMIGTPLPDKSGESARPITAGDFLVLVRRRSEVFHDIIRECKARGLPVAGADRLKVGGELAVKDLAALLAFLATPEDSLSLASALRSPLFGWSEAELYRLAHGRARPYLWAELRAKAESHPETVAVLDDLRNQVDFLRPYELIERILTRHGGREKLLARLGHEAEDGIDALLTQAMAYERSNVDSLTGFLVWMETDDLEIKRQMDSAGDRIRVMTVHGSKGLEAPVVILPDTAAWRARSPGDLAVVGEAALWRSGGKEVSKVQRAIDAAQRDVSEAERNRLLYVAMTRAEQWLILGAAGDLGKDGQSWHDKVRAGMEALGASPLATDLGEGLRLEDGQWPEIAQEAVAAKAEAPVPLPACFRHPAPEVEALPETLSPSGLGGAKALPGEEGLDEDAAKLRGSRVHRLLELLPALPEAEWPKAARALLADGTEPLTEAEAALLLEEAASVLGSPVMQEVFAPGSLAEVPVSANLPTLAGRRIHGIIDRLVVSPGHVLAVDFKTNAMVPPTPAACPDGLLRQMGAYAEALAQLYPGRRISTALLWTRAPSLMVLPHDLVSEALANTTLP